jgi:hypothetical protein
MSGCINVARKNGRNMSINLFCLLMPFSISAAVPAISAGLYFLIHRMMPVVHVLLLVEQSAIAIQLHVPRDVKSLRVPQM